VSRFPESAPPAGVALTASDFLLPATVRLLELS